jgi:hypothetical protein
MQVSNFLTIWRKTLLVMCIPNSKVNGRVQFILDETTTRACAKYAKSLTNIFFKFKFSLLLHPNFEYKD